MVPDVVYLVGDQPDDSFRWSLRSLAHIPHGAVWVAGVAPEGFTLGSIPVTQKPPKSFATTRNLRAACGDDRVADWFYLFCDDFYVMEPVDTVPYLHDGHMKRRNARKPLSITGSRTATAEQLKQWGVSAPLNFEVHQPMLMHRPTMRDLLGRTELRAVALKSLYANMADGVEPVKSRDCKVFDAKKVGHGPFWSTNNVSWLGKAGAAVKAAFPDPCQYEL